MSTFADRRNPPHRPSLGALRTWVIAFALVLVAASLATAQTTHTLWLHKEFSTQVGRFALKTTGPDAAALLRSTGVGNGQVGRDEFVGEWVSSPGTPNVGVILRGSTFRFRLWTRKSADRGTLYPYVHLQLNNSSDFTVGSNPAEVEICRAQADVAVSTTWALSSFSCTFDKDLKIGSLDRFYLQAGFYMTVGPGSKAITFDLGVDGLGSPIYDSRIEITVPANPRITSVTPVVGGANTVLTINGVNFGAGGPGSVVTVGDELLSVTSWTATRIIGTYAGGDRGIIRVKVGSLGSNPWSFFARWHDTLCQPQLSSQLLGPIAYNGGPLTVAVTAPPGCMWSVNSSASWITASPAAGSGSAGVTLTVAEHPALTYRAATLDVNGVPLMVVQRAPVDIPAYAVHPPPAFPILTLEPDGTISCFLDKSNTTSQLLGMDIYGDDILIASTSSGGSLFTMQVAAPAGLASNFYCAVSSIPDGMVVIDATLVSPGPHISSLSPAAGPPGGFVTVTGTTFGPPGTGTLAFGGVAATVLSWSDTQIQALVPAGTPLGAVLTRVTASSGRISNTVTFTVGALVDPGGTLSFFHTDVVGSVRAITDVTGTIVSEYNYLPFGQEWGAPSPTDPNRLLFTGQERDRETGADGLGWSPLDYFASRHYQSQSGRFAQPDVPGIAFDPSNPQSFNLYAYAANNPLRYVDPSGHQTTCPPGSEAMYCSGVTETLPKPTKPNPSKPDPVSPWLLGWEWLTGHGPRHRTFSDGDAMAEQLKQHSHIQEVVAGACDGTLDPSGREPYNLGGFQGVPKYLRDYSTVLTGGRAGNLTVTYLGSYGLSYSKSGNTVTMTATNSSTVASGFRPPVIGYTAAWDQYVGRPLNSAFSSGPMSRTTQSFNLTMPCQ